MQTLIDTFTTTGSLHHAYLFVGERELTRKQLLSFIETHMQQPIHANPDLWHSEHDTFTIDEARKLREAQSDKAIAHTKKIFIIELQSITIEAQNSLLKVFEEPTPDTHFFIIVPSAEIIVSTLRSRVMIIHGEDMNINTEKIREFLKLSLSERLKIVDTVAEEKNKTEAMRLVDGIITVLHSEKNQAAKSSHKVMKKEHTAHVLEELLMVRGYLSDRSPSLKLLLEHTALVVPQNLYYI